MNCTTIVVVCVDEWGGFTYRGTFRGPNKGARRRFRRWVERIDSKDACVFVYTRRGYGAFYADVERTIHIQDYRSGFSGRTTRLVGRSVIHT